MEDTQENEMYVKAIKALNKHNKLSEHHKIAEYPKEIDFMNDIQKVVSRKSLSIPYKNDQYELIFKGKNI